MRQNPQRPVHALLGRRGWEFTFDLPSRAWTMYETKKNFEPKKGFLQTKSRLMPVLGTITNRHRLSKSIHIKRPEVLGLPCLNVNVNLPIYYTRIWKKNHKYLITAGFYFAKYEKAIIVSDGFVLLLRTANAIRTRSIYTT